MLRLLFLICDSTPTPLASRQSAWSPSSSATLAAVVLLGPAGAALVGAISVISLRRHLILAERLFNGAMYAVSGYAAGSAYVALGGPVGRLLPPDSPGVIWPFAVAAAVHVITNQGLLWGALQLIRRDGRPTERVRVESSLPLLLASDLGYAVLGLLIAALWTVTYAFAAVLVLVPLIVARWAMGQFAEQQRRVLGHDGGALPGGRDEGLLHPRAQRAGLPRLGHDRQGDRHAAGPGRGHQVRGHAARRRQARRSRPRCCRRTAR